MNVATETQALTRFKTKWLCGVFWQFLRFIQQRGVNVHSVTHSLADPSDDTVLRNSDLTDKGFYFVQSFHGRWLNRTRKDSGEAKENAFLI